MRWAPSGMWRGWVVAWAIALVAPTAMAGPQSGGESAQESEEAELRRREDVACYNWDCYEEPPPPPAKKGHIDGVALANGHAELHGWTCQPGRVEPNDVDVYVGGPAGIGYFVVRTKANGWSEASIAAQCNLTGSTYRFYIPLFDDFRAQHPGKALYVYALSPVGGPVLLGGSGHVTVPAIVSGTLTAAPNPCTIPWGGALCTVNVGWNSSAPGAEVWVTDLAGNNPTLFARSQDGVASASWIRTSGARFHLKAGGWSASTLSTVDVHGTPTVNAAPTVSLAAPTHGQQFLSGTTVTLSASASDSDDGVARVEFLAGGAKVGEDTSAPYTFSWSPADGTHAIAARAVDTRGTQTTSATASITVAPPAPPTIGDGSGASSIAPDSASDGVGATAAEFRVDESGAATYSIALYGVPGTAGVDPKLSLRYSSQGGDGPLGRGWSIGGTSSISRCRATREAGDFIVGGVATDGTPSPVDFSANDRYCLDGQRVIPAPAGAAACQAVGGMTVLNLRTEIESFQRVCAYTPVGGTNGVAFFTVERKDGSISWYGDRDSDAGANRPDGYFNSTAPGKTGFALSWAQTRFQDSTGNYIDYRYLEDPAGAGTGEHLLSEVRYTGRVALAGQSTGASAPYAKVMFNYAAYPENAWRRGYAAGGVLTQTRRLASITACNSAAAGCGTANQARFYQLTYAASVSGSGADLLTHVQECRDSTRGVCLPATTFAWSGARNVFSTWGSWDPGDFGSTVKFEGLKLGDIDGDGRQDLVWLKDGSSGETCPTEHVMVAFGQLDGAGRQTFSGSVLAGCTPNELMSGLGEGSWQLFDYTGDGRDDLFVAGNGAWMLYPSQGRTSQPFNTHVDLLAGIHIPVSVAAFHPQLNDLNGDGLLDVVYYNSNGVQARLMERAGASWRWGAERRATFRAEPPPSCPPGTVDGCTESAPILREPRRFALNDFNGDAASDLVFTVTTQWKVACYATDQDICRPGNGNRSTQTAYAYGVSQLTPTTIEFKRQTQIPLDTANGAHTVLGDFNGDGLTDIASGANGLWRYALNSGAGFLPTVQLGSFMWPELVKTADVNGDGRSDLLFIQPDAYNVARYYVQHGTRTGGLGAVEPVPDAMACFNTGCDPRSVVNLFTDLDGDGGLDYFAIRVFNDRSEFYLAQPDAASRGKPRDAIVSITNGLGARTELTYAALSNPGVHLPDSGSRDANHWGRGAPVRDFKAPSFVVAQAASSSPQAGAPDAMARLYYRYAGAKVQAGGRGFLGFREIATIDPNRTGGYVVTTTAYHQHFPFTGLPASTTKAMVANQAYTPSGCIAQPIANACYASPGAGFASLGGSWFSAHTQLWEADTDSNGTSVAAFAPGVQAPVHVRTAGTEEKLRDPFVGGQTSRVVTAFDYGTHGNAVTTVVDTYEGTAGSALASVVTANTYGDNAALWRLGRLTGSTVTHRRAGAADVVRTTAFEYAMGGAATGLLTAERTQPNTSLELRKQFTYDDYGNKIVAAACAAPASGCGEALAFQPGAPETVQRYARTQFDSKGRFPVATIEPFTNGEHATQTVLARDLFGGVAHAQDANGVDTLALPGTLGRAYYSWVETVPGSVPGSGNGGSERITTYRWCGSGGVTCPVGARFRSRTLSDAAPTEWTWFDLLGRPILQASETFNVGVSGQDVVAVCTSYDASGQPLRVSNPFFLPGKSVSLDSAVLANQCSGRASTMTSVDLLGRPTDVQSPDGAIVSTGYAGLRTLITDARGHTTTETRNGLGERIAVTDAAGFTQSFAYNADGTLARIVRDAGGGQIVNAFTYDVLGRKTVQDDPDSGLTQFTHNALGELIAQQDASGNRIENDLDARGRAWRRTVRQPDGTIESRSTFAFDTAGAVGAPADEMIGGNYTHTPGSGQGELAVSFERRYRYDGLGRPSGSTTTIDGTDYVTAVQYDALGRAAKVQDASGRWARTEFNARGMAAAVCESSASDAATLCPASAQTYQRTLSTDVWGKPVRERRGNSAAMDIVRTHRSDNGRLATLCAGNTACHLVGEEYAWDANGNLLSQLKEGRYLEAFEYDRLNRLTRSTASVGGGSVLTYAADYDALGNACNKAVEGAVRTLVYAGRARCGTGAQGAGGPHQVAQFQVGGETANYHYDARGNQTLRDLPGTANDRSIRYTADNQAHEIALGNGTRARFWYGSDGQRYKREDGGRRTLYLGNVEIVIDGGVVTTRRNVGGVLMQSIVGSVVTSRYLFHDRLGNVVKVTDATGAVIESHDFHPFGERRNPTHPDWTTTIKSNFTTRGFTGHEMVDGLGVIHMNGRIYDPDIGRFLQPDPVIQAPFNPQSWNAYTYVFNNPLTYTDPSGMIGIKERQWLGIAVTIAAAIVATYVAPSMKFVFVVGAGAAAGGISTGSTQGALYGAFSAGMFYGVGTYFNTAQWAQATSTSNAFGSGITWGAYGAKVLAHGATGGVMASLQGGRFGDGFASAGVAQAFAPGIGRIGNAPGRVAAAAIIGGTSSELSGGKFANGAITAAFGRAFNDERHLSPREHAAISGAAHKTHAEYSLMTNEELLETHPDMLRLDPDADAAATYGYANISHSLTEMWSTNLKDMLVKSTGSVPGEIAEFAGGKLVGLTLSSAPALVRNGWKIYDTGSFLNKINPFATPDVQIACNSNGCVYLLED